MRAQNRNLKLASTIATVLAGLGAAQATPLPASQFTYNVVNNLVPACAVGIHSNDGSCNSGPNFATTDGGTLNNTGTGVSSGASGPGVSSLATVTYYFEVGGPIVPAVPGGQTGQIAVDILSSGTASLLGGRGSSFATLTITDAGGDDDIAAGVPDPDANFVVDSRTFGVNCGAAGCTTVGAPWAQSTQIGAGFTAPDHLCLTQGDRYKIVITASTFATGAGASGGASVDPKIIVDPQGPADPNATCYQPVDPTVWQAAILISDGASTGVSVAEPGTLGLLGLGLLGLGLGRRSARRSRPPA